MKIKIRSISGEYPAYETPGAAGMDIKAFLREPVTIKPMERRIIPTGLFMEIERGYEVQIRARSGLAVKHGIGLINGIGTIDSDYRGEIGVALIKLGQNVNAPPADIIIGPASEFIPFIILRRFALVCADVAVSCFFIKIAAVTARVAENAVEDNFYPVLFGFFAK